MNATIKPSPTQKEMAAKSLFHYKFVTNLMHAKWKDGEKVYILKAQLQDS